jgi:tetratricopeptide (TPR) repeat protein
VYLLVMLLAAGLALAPSSIVSAQTMRNDDGLAEAGRLNQEAASLYSAGKLPEAVPLVQRALAIREKALGPEHPDVAASLDALAGLYRAQGQYRDAERPYRRALAIREKTLGRGNPALVLSLNNLAGLYRAQGKYAEAEPL